MVACVWNDWLPEPLAAEIRSEEPKRYEALVRHLAAQWQRDKAALGPVAAAEATLPYVPLAKCLINARAEPPGEVLALFADTLLDIVLRCEADLVPQVRWAQQLHRLLRVHRRKLKLVVPWRPLYSMLRRHGLEPSAAYEGGGVSEARHGALVTLAHRCRRFFPPSAAAEMWAQFSPALADPQRPECFEALGWLALLLPTHEALRGEGGWGDWAPRWLDLWQQLDHCRYWDSLWYNLFSRLAKHDVRGLVDWAPLLPRLFTRFMWACEVPVGAATGAPPFTYPAPALCQLLFSAEQKSRSSCIAKAAVYLLGRYGGGGDDQVLGHLEAVVNLVEQYYHPSNSGRWSGTLSNLMKELTHHLCKRLVAERHAAAGAGADSDEEGEDVADADLDDPAASGGEDAGGAAAGLRPPSGLAADADDSSSGDEEAAAATPPGAARPGARRPLAAAARRGAAALLLRLALKAQFAKDRGSARVASQVLAALAQLAPDLVLRHVHSHFTTALETVTAAGQLGTAIQSLSLCVRPLLVAGLAAEAAASGGAEPEPAAAAGEPPPPAGGEARLAAAQAVASALMATLPGIDANDEPKSLATFRFYCCALGCLGQLPEAPTPGVPLYTEEWVEELLSRCFAVIASLDAPEHRGEHGGQGGKGEEGSFLLDSNSMFRPLMELLFARLPPPLRRAATRRVAKFLLESTFASVGAEASVLCNSVAWADPQYTAEVLLAPLVDALCADLPAAAAAAGAPRLSKAHEASLAWRLGLLSSTAFRAGPALPPFAPRVLRIVRALAAAPSQLVQEAAARAVGSLLSGLLSLYPRNQHAPCADVYDLGEGLALEAFIDKFGAGCSQPLTWHEPSAEEVAFAEQLLQASLMEPAARLRALAAGGEVPREELKGLLLQIEGALGGARSGLPDLPPAPGPAADAVAAAVVEAPLGLVGRGGAALADGGAARAAVAEALLAAADAVGATGDGDTLRQLVAAMDGVVAIGAAEYADSTANLAAWNSDEKWMHEPAVAGLLRAQQGVAPPRGGGAPGERWRRRRPRWLVAEKVYLNLEWRASQAAYRPWASLRFPAPPADYVPPLAAALARAGARFATHSYPEVREAAAALLERAVKRYPCLAPLAVPPLLAALAKIPAEECPWGTTVEQLLPALQRAVAGAAAAAAAAGETGEPEAEADQALAIGACRLLEGRALWRHVSRHWPSCRGLLLALLASAAHTGAEAQAAVFRCHLITAYRLTTPPARDDPQAAALVADVLAAAEQPALHWRYRCMAECGLVMLLPLLDADSGAAVARHWAALLTSDMLLLRQLAAAGLTMLLLPLWRPPLPPAAPGPPPGAPPGGDAVMADADAGGGDAPPDVPPAAVAAAADALRAAALADAPGFAAALFRQLAHGHPLLGAEGAQARYGRQSMGMSRDDMMTKMISKTLTRAAIWPHGRESVPALGREEFIPAQAQLVQVLAQAAPACVPAFRAPLEAALSQPQDVDRPATAAAAEVLAGLLSVPAVYSSGDWAEWLRPALRQALSAAPLENADLWCSCALRYATHHLAAAELAGGGAEPGGAPSPLQLLLDSVAEPLPEGSTSAQVYKRLLGLLLAAAEVATASGTAHPPPLLRRLQARLLLELPSLAELPGENVRLAAAQLAVFVPCSVVEGGAAERLLGGSSESAGGASAADGACGGGNGAGGNGGSDAEVVVEAAHGGGSAGSLDALQADAAPDAPLLLVRCGGAALRRAAVDYLDGLVARFDAAVDRMFVALRSGEAGGEARLTPGGSGAATPPPGAPPPPLDAAALTAAVEAEMSEAAGSEPEHGGEGGAAVLMSEDEGVLLVGPAAAGAPAGGAAGGGGVAGVQGSPEYQAAVAHVSFTVQAMVQALTGGEGPELAPWLARMLGPLLRLQEVVPSELQFLALEARKALACLKYLPLPPALVAPVLATLEQASTAELWPERGAALLFAQYFWFRHAFLLGRDGTARVLALVTRMLEDGKLEVREMAAATLSGLIKGLPPAEAAALRQRFVARALALFPTAKRRRTAAGAAPPATGEGATLAQRHGAVLGLRAFVLSTPYDVPGWLPDVLLALARLAPEPPPLRAAVTKTLAEFRRTHEEAGLAEVRGRLTEEQWEAIRDVASPASYFV